MGKIDKLIDALKQRRKTLIEKSTKIIKINNKEDYKELYQKSIEFDEERFSYGNCTLDYFLKHKDPGQEDFKITFEEKLVGSISMWDHSKNNKNKKCIAIVIDKELRGNSIANHSLQYIINNSFKNNPDLEQIMAFINIKNQDSKNLFINNGFEITKYKEVYMLRYHKLEEQKLYTLTRKKHERR